MDTKSLLPLVLQGVGAAGSNRLSKKVVAAVREQAGDSYPKFFDSPLGRALEPAVIPALVVMFTEGTDSSTAKKIRAVCKSALVGSGADLVDYVEHNYGQFMASAASIASLYDPSMSEDEDD